MTNYLTRPQIKKRARQTMKHHYGTAFALNWLPMIGIILIGLILVVSIGVFIAAYLTSETFRHTVNTAVNSAAKAGRDGSAASNGGINPFTSFGGSLIGTIINTGIVFASLEWLRLKDDQVLEHPFKKAFQGFKFDYLLGIIVLYLLTSIASIVGLMLFIIPGILFDYALRIVYLLYYDVGDKYGYLELLKLSWKLMRGHKFDLFIFQLSFFWWYLGVICTFGLLSLYVIPYYNLAFAAFYDNIYQNSELATENSNDTTDSSDTINY
ncbi:DUF975 family protein [Lapidilactobacillus bayanensis]|uniref:DUF975 family protein n=1 Tax=Lapidilactobacillus bayanensis TaxID=2485998 RepID=UPI000F77F850|nr:DUF975 family protein [Lapidilactobacillus bayanensis]